MMRPKSNKKKRSSIYDSMKHKQIEQEKEAKKSIGTTQEIEAELKKMEKMVLDLNEAYQNFFSGKGREPKVMRRELENLIRKYQRGSLPRAALKFRFENIQSKMALYRPRWEEKLREMRFNDITFTTTEATQVEREAINKIFDLSDFDG
ncbi:MAG: hypothetical protein D6675_06490 [Gemmatimonadetes bacterium]|nr:MAG: hypothetical protein D6675_06490 [Gemmatimonadota bacterium]